MVDHTRFPIQLPFDFPPNDEASTQPTPSSIVIAPPADRRWLDYFSRETAVAAVAAHIATLGSSRTPEQHTRVGYEAGLRYLLDALGDQLPTLDRMQAITAGLAMRGLAPSTINAKYLAVARHYLRALSRQRFPGLRHADRDYFNDCRDEIALAATIKSVPRGASPQSSLYRDDFVRLNEAQIAEVLNRIVLSTRAGLRDIAMLLLGFSTGLRLAEMRRITLSSIKSHAGGYIIIVRRKRLKFDPVVLDGMVYDAILRWVESFNSGLSPDDPRRITGNTPVWQPLSRTGGYLIAGRNGYDPSAGLSGQGFRDVIERRTAVLGPEYVCGVHDMRRSVAANLDERGVKVTVISAVLGHENIATTDRYIGRKLDVKAQNVMNYLDFGAATAA